MFADLDKYKWVSKLRAYRDKGHLMQTVLAEIIAEVTARKA
jgi:hypothetical protein